jgi:hypothetical protein
MTLAVDVRGTNNVRRSIENNRKNAIKTAKQVPNENWGEQQCSPLFLNIEKPILY